ncbi:MAG: hypothetical protein MI810_09810 [Flavobacteriales bacterium]|nr:hypothetical protein [Flavobacteriales bacterium]
MYTRIISCCLGVLLLAACSKGEGPGGKATITGTVTKQNQAIAKNEIIEVTIIKPVIDAEVQVQHTDYFLLNAPAGATQYYVYYTNTGAGTSGDPGLSGREGIEVTYDNFDTNLELASQTENAIVTQAGVDFSVHRNGDLLTISNKIAGYVIDSDKGTSKFDINVKEDGRTASVAEVENAVDEKVYIVYGEQEVYGDVIRTGGDGKYQFAGLKKGNYTIYCVSIDPETGFNTQEQIAITISSGKEEVAAPDINILY